MIRELQGAAGDEVGYTKRKFTFPGGEVTMFLAKGDELVGRLDSAAGEAYNVTTVAGPLPAGSRPIPVGPKPTIQVKYSCKGCGRRNAVVTVVARGEEDVVAWLRGKVDAAVSADHGRMSPLCGSKTFDLMVPYGDEGSPVGAPVRPV